MVTSNGKRGGAGWLLDPSMMKRNVVLCPRFASLHSPNRFRDTSITREEFTEAFAETR
jgi:hypothetical protein